MLTDLAASLSDASTKNEIGQRKHSSNIKPSCAMSSFLNKLVHKVTC